MYLFIYVFHEYTIFNVVLVFILYSFVCMDRHTSRMVNLMCKRTRTEISFTLTQRQIFLYNILFFLHLKLYEKFSLFFRRVV